MSLKPALEAHDDVVRLDEKGPWWRRPIPLLRAHPGGNRYSQLANRKASRWRWTGGKLFLTDDRLEFLAHFADHLLRQPDRSVALSDVETAPVIDDQVVSKQARVLSVRLREGTTEKFVVTDPDEFARQIAVAIRTQPDR